ncbi:MAG: hypothetical protein HKN37_11070 [Rhodothermales bacterium]|nr:hypothetical protein [Rhodothermales bacterium]
MHHVRIRRRGSDERKGLLSNNETRRRHNIHVNPTVGTRDLAGITTRAHVGAAMQFADEGELTALLRNSSGPGADGRDELVVGLHRQLSVEATRFTLPLNGTVTIDIGSAVREVLSRTRSPALADYGTRARLLRATSCALRQLLVECAERCCDGGDTTSQPGVGDDPDGFRREANDQSLADPRVGRVVFGEQTISALLKLDSALTSLEAIDAVRADVATCVLFGRLSASEIAAAHGCQLAIIKKHWALGHIWLHRQMENPKRPSVQDGRQP